MPEAGPPRVLVTGAAGHVGRRLVERLAGRPGGEGRTLALDLRPVPAGERLPGVLYRDVDIRSPALGEAVAAFRPRAVVHLAAVVTAPPGMDRRTRWSIDVGGTDNLLAACRDHGVRRLVVTSSGAAYGYRPDHPRWIDESRPLRADPSFPYAWNKRAVEERLAAWRRRHPELEQVVFRVGTVLGHGISNPITALFRRPVLVAVRGGDDRFVFAWEDDVAACLERAVTAPVTGVFNLAGDGALPMAELARRMDKPLVRLPAGLLRAALAVARPLGLAEHGPEHVRFLQYRPVLDNRRLVEELGFRPELDSGEAFDRFVAGMPGSGPSRR